MSSQRVSELSENWSGPNAAAQLGHGVPLILTADKLREVVHTAVERWAREFPWEVRGALDYCENYRKGMYHTSGKSKGGDIHAVGAVPHKVMRMVGEVLNDHSWIHHHEQALAILLDEFKPGVFGQYVGTGREGAGAHRPTLTKWDLEHGD